MVSCRLLVLSCQLPAAPQLVRRRVLFSNPNATYEQSSNSSRGRGGKVGVFPQALSSLDLVGIARATKGDVTPAGGKFCEILRQLSGNSSRITSVKSRDSTRIPIRSRRRSPSRI